MVQKRHRLLFFSKGQQIKKKPSAFAQISLPVPINFVARADKFCCPWFHTTTGNVFHYHHHGLSRRRAWIFRPILADAKNLRKN